MTPDPPRAHRRPTMQDIATAAGVSKGLVSLILRGAPGPSAESAARVLTIAQGLGYRFNRAASLLARHRSRLLGVTMEPGNPFHGELVEHIQRVTAAHGYEIALGAVTAAHPERRAIEALLDLRCEALLLLGSELPARTLPELVGDVPAVSVGRPLRAPGIDVVRAADRAGMALLVDHLVGLGHARIAHLDGGPTVVSGERREGYRAALRRHDLPALILPGGAAERDGIDGGAALLARHPEVTAVLAYNDKAAVGVLQQFDSVGVRVPEDVSVAGFDNSVLAQLSRIDLTTISQETSEQAELAVAALVERLDGGRTRRVEHVLAPHLVVRGTTGPRRTSPPRPPLIDPSRC